MSTTTRLPASRLIPWIVLGLLLLAPLVAMRLTDQVDWRPGDFLAAALLFGGPLALWQGLAPRLGPLPRAVLAAALVVGVALVFGTLALSD